jgi:hypothetical protein
MYSLEIIKRINAADPKPAPFYELRFHPRIVALTRIVNQLPVNKEYRRWLRHSLWLYADQIIARVEPAHDEGWDDLEDLQQVTLSDRMAASMDALCSRYN